MHHSPINIKSIFTTGIASLVLFLLILFTTYYRDNPKVVFCDVGQGDAIYIRLPQSFDILVDAGANNKVLHCLGAHMPLYDKTIELGIITHPQKDHYFGFLSLIDRYTFRTFLVSPVDNPPNKSFQKLIQTIQSRSIPLKIARQGQFINVPTGKLHILWPSMDYIDKTTNLQKNSILRLTKYDLNNFSVIAKLVTSQNSLLLTGDATPEVLTLLHSSSMIQSDILKVPHHGSSNGLTTSFLERVKPTVSVISVGKDNRFNHPKADILKMLQESSTKIMRTDTDGEILIWL